MPLIIENLSDHNGQVKEEVSALEITGLSTWAAVAGSIGILLNAHSRASTSSLYVGTNTLERRWKVNPQVDQDSSVQEYLAHIEESCPELASEDTFSIHIEDLEFELAHSLDEQDPGNAIVLLPILCTTLKIDGSLWLKLEAHGKSFLSSTRFLRQILHVTRELLATGPEDERRINNVDLLCDLDRSDIQQWNQQAPLTEASTVHELVRTTVSETPQSRAVDSWDGTLTYEELDSLSSNVCSKLLESGVRPGDCVPLCFEKSLWTVVAMLGVLKSGCAFLLMDVTHPTARLQTLVEEVKATMLLTSADQQDRAQGLAAQALVVSAESITLAPNETSVHQQPRTDPSALAAIMFTSGTTGTPKAIALEHRSVCSSLLALSKFSGLDRSTRYFQFSSHAFDAAFGDMLMTLMSGGCICIPSENDRLSRLAESIRHFNANTVLLTPTVLRLLSPSDVPCLTTLLSGGERVTQDLVERWGNTLRLIIVYGPAETTVTCIAKRALTADDAAIRIGFPINSRAWIVSLDNPDHLAPVGAPGELVVESPGVARGYVNNTSDNASLFLDVPPGISGWEIDTKTTSRCYRTGDLVQYAEDGEIIFIGRRDRQVKLRGQRIELEDIETKLQNHVQIPGSRVILEVLNLDGNSHLVAFILDKAGQDAPREQSGHNASSASDHVQQEIEFIRECISDELPSYMWPVAWIPIKQLPSTPTGKLDRRKLQRLGKDYHNSLSAESGTGIDLTPIQSVLATMWKQLLQFATQDLSPESHFFKLGGDSLRAMKLVTMARQKGYQLTTATVFRHPTISDMARAMETTVTATSTVGNVNHPPSPDPASSIIKDDESTSIYSYLRGINLGLEQVEDIVPCTPLQEGLFSLSLTRPSLYSSQFVFHLPAEVDFQTFQAACDSAIKAFPILRTVIVSTVSGLVQTVLRASPSWKVIEKDLADFLAADKEKNFQTGEPLARFHYVQDLAGKIHLVWTLHHAIYDGWSLDSVLNSIRDEYRQRGSAQSPSGSFKNFVQFCQGIDHAVAGQYWTEQLAGAPTPSFPTLPTTACLTTDSTCLRHTMDAASVSTHKSTATVLARASWALLLSEYEGSDDIVFGNSLHGRNSLPPELQDVVGPTIATLPIRVKIDRSETIKVFLDSLQDQFSTMIPHEQFGLPRIMAISQDIKNAASFRTLLIVQVEDADVSDLSKIKMEEIDRSLHEYPLVLTLTPRGPQIEIVTTFDSAVISITQAHRLVGQFEQAFHQICAAPEDRKLEDLELASAADKATMFEWNARSHKVFDICVHEMIQEQVKRSPHAQAIYSEPQNLDYATLDKLSNGLAAELSRSGVLPGSVVGVLFEKSIWAPVSILAVIKAGCAFAPLSPSSPTARLEAIAHDCKIDMVICSTTQEKKFSDAYWRTIVIDEQALHSLQTTVPPHRDSTTPDSLLYVLSTSGTTGTPKSFAVQHKAFATGALARAPLIKRDSESRVLQFAPYGFDPSVEDILTTFMFGGCVCVPSDDDIMGDLSAFMRRAKVNFANITPSVAHSLEHDKLTDLKVLLLSGEAPDQALVDKWAGKVKLMNGYGPSECSVKCSINCHLSRDNPRNIGHSVGTSIWVLCPSNHNVISPLGALGELVIESPNLAMGYLNRPKTTEEKFINSPQWLRKLRNGQITRLYKTGDLVRYQEDGSIVYSGRGDLQLKINGQRLEGEEVRQHVQQCFNDEHINVLVDTVKFQGQESELLAAFLAVKGRRTETFALDSELQHHILAIKAQIGKRLESVLPKYMIPAVFLAVTNIPVTANGKADRRLLKAYMQQQRLQPLFVLSDRGQVLSDPVTQSEKLLHSLWQKLLGLNSQDFGANAHFFEAAGSSLLAIRLAAAVRDRGYSLTPRQILENPILSSMAAEMKPLTNGIRTPKLHKFGLLKNINCTVNALMSSLAAYKIFEYDVENAYPCTRQQKRYIEGERIAPGGTTYRHIIPLPDHLDMSKFETAVKHVVQANAFLRTRIVPVSSEVIQVVLKDDFECPHVDNLSTVRREDQDMSWGYGQPQSRFRIVDRDDSGTRYFTWSSAHAVFDGWIRKLFLEDIDHAYHHDSVPPVRPQAESFIEYVYNQQTDDGSHKLIKTLGDRHFLTYYPSSQSSKAPRISHFLSLDVDFPPSLPTSMSYPTMVLTAWAIVAAKVENYTDFLFNILLGGRDAPLTGIDNLMGPTTTTAPLAISINNQSTIRHAMDAMQMSILDAGSLQHSLELGDKLSELLTSAPVLMVHPPEDYLETPTKTLELRRSRAEIVTAMGDAVCMNFSLRPGNSGVDLLFAIDETRFPREKAEMYLGYLEQVLTEAFVPERMDSRIQDIDFEAMSPLSSVRTRTDYMS